MGLEGEGHRTLGVGVDKELAKAVDEVRAVEGVPANAHAEGLAQANSRRLANRFVCQRTRARNNACGPHGGRDYVIVSA